MKDNQKEVLKAWIDGEACEYKYTGTDTWADCTPFIECNQVSFLHGVEYRIKPKNIVTTTRIERSTQFAGDHNTYRDTIMKHNLKLTWSPDGKTLLKAWVI